MQMPINIKNPNSSKMLEFFQSAKMVDLNNTITITYLSNITVPQLIQPNQLYTHITSLKILESLSMIQFILMLNPPDTFQTLNSILKINPFVLPLTLMCIHIYNLSKRLLTSTEYLSLSIHLNNN